MAKRAGVRKQVWTLLNRDGTVWARTIDGALMTLIVLNVIAIMLETMQELAAWHPWFRLFDLFSVGIFTIEYLIRFWSCTAEATYRGIRGRLRYVMTPLALIDLAAILPFYIPRIISFDLRILWALRLLRIFRLLKLSRYTHSLHVIGRVLHQQKEELFVTFFLGLVLLAIGGTGVYLFESRAQPEVFTSIPSSLWLSFEAITTIGFGDIAPITLGGKIFTAVVGVLGIGMVAMPAGILGSGFIEEFNARKRPRRCPHCKKQLPN